MFNVKGMINFYIVLYKNDYTQKEEKSFHVLQFIFARGGGGMVLVSSKAIDLN